MRNMLEMKVEVYNDIYVFNYKSRDVYRPSLSSGNLKHVCVHEGKYKTLSLYIYAIVITRSVKPCLYELAVLVFHASYQNHSGRARS